MPTCNAHRTNTPAGVLDELKKIQKVEPQTFKVAYAYTAIPGALCFGTASVE